MIAALFRVPAHYHGGSDGYLRLCQVSKYLTRIWNSIVSSSSTLSNFSFFFHLILGSNSDFQSVEDVWKYCSLHSDPPESIIHHYQLIDGASTSNQVVLYLRSNQASDSCLLFEIVSSTSLPCLVSLSLLPGLRCRGWQEASS